MKMKILLESLVTGVICIAIFLVFSKVTGMDVPTWLGGIIIVGLIGGMNVYHSREQSR